MENNHTYVGLVILGLMTTSTLFAQAEAAKDSTFIQELVIEKQYIPTLRDVDKITRMPQVEKTITQATPVNFTQPQLFIQAPYELAPIDADNILTDYDFNRRRAYIGAAMGNYFNIQADAGVRFIDKEKTILGLYLNTNNTDGDVGYTRNTDVKVNRKLSQSLMKLYFEHEFERIAMHTDLSYRFDVFNYFGDTTAIAQPTTSVPLAPHVDQKVHYVDFNIDFVTPEKTTGWNHQAGIGVSSFSNRYPDLKETKLDFHYGMGVYYSDRWSLHADAELDVLFYGQDSQTFQVMPGQDFKNSLLIGLNPYFKYRNPGILDARLGLDVDVASGLGSNFGIAPNFDLNLVISETCAFYAELKGGVKQNSVASTYFDYRYRTATERLANSYQIADLNLGFHTNFARGLNLDLYGRIGYTENELVMASQLQEVTFDTLNIKLNSLRALSQNVTAWKFGVNSSYTYNDIFKTYLNLRYNGYGINDADFVSYRPAFELDLGFFVRPFEALSIGVDYQSDYKRDALIYDMSSSEPQAVKMDDLHNLNVKANWQFTDNFVLYAHLNNLLFRRQEVYYGMPEQRFNFLLGARIQFGKF